MPKYFKEKWPRESVNEMSLRTGWLKLRILDKIKYKKPLTDEDRKIIRDARRSDKVWYEAYKKAQK